MRESRRRRFIDKTVQGMLVSRVLLHWMTFLASSFVILYVWQFLLSGDPQRPFSPHMQEVAESFIPVVVVFVCLLPAFIWDTVKFSHRFVGPIYRLRKSMQSIAAGEPLRPVKLRKGDFWQAAANDFNAMIQRIEADKLLAAQSREEAESENSQPSEPALAGK
jgi:hypothetical protein